MRVIAERNRKSEQWRAWIEDEPEHQYSGETVIDAVDALVRARRDEIPEAYWLEVDGQNSSLDRWEYVLAPIPLLACPDCGGEVGREECLTCNGTGVVPI